MAVRAVLGTMTYGPNGQTKPEQALEQLLMFTGDAASKVAGGPGIQAAGQVLVDTARGYQGGATEETIGALLAAHPELRSKMSIATKAAPPLDRAAIRAKCEASLAALQTDHVDLYYLHQPDVSVDLDETLSTMNALHKEGKFKEFGLSNYAGWEVVDIWHRCKEKGWVLPTVYQGMYNGITRDCEKHLFPALRRVGMRFVRLLSHDDLATVHAFSMDHTDPRRLCIASHDSTATIHSQAACSQGSTQAWTTLLWTRAVDSPQSMPGQRRTQIQDTEGATSSRRSLPQSVRISSFGVFWSDE